MEANSLCREAVTCYEAVRPGKLASGENPK